MLNFKRFKSRLSIILCVILFSHQTLFASTISDYISTFTNIITDTLVYVYTTEEVIDDDVSEPVKPKETSFVKQLLVNIVASIENELLNQNLTDDERARLLLFKNGFSNMYEKIDTFILFSDEYTNEQKKEMLTRIIEQIRKDTGSSLPTSNSNSWNTPTDQIIGIGEPLHPDGYYCIILPHPKGDEYGYGIFFNLEYSSGDIGYFGGNVDTAFYLNGELIESYSDNMGWDIATNRQFGRIYSVSPKLLGDTFNPNIENIVEVKTNVLGDYKFTLNSPNVEYHTLDDKRLIAIRNASKNIITYWTYNTTPPTTTSSMLIIK